MNTKYNSSELARDLNCETALVGVKRGGLRFPKALMAPRTIKEYKSALLRMGVSLPAGQTRLADYQALWEEMAAQKEEAPATKSHPMPSSLREPLGDASRVFSNVPLSMQKASEAGPTARAYTNVPLSAQLPQPRAAASPIAAVAEPATLHATLEAADEIEGYASPRDSLEIDHDVPLERVSAHCHTTSRRRISYTSFVACAFACTLLGAAAAVLLWPAVCNHPIPALPGSLDEVAVELPLPPELDEAIAPSSNEAIAPSSDEAIAPSSEAGLDQGGLLLSMDDEQAGGLRPCVGGPCAELTASMPTYNDTTATVAMVTINAGGESAYAPDKGTRSPRQTRETAATVRPMDAELTAAEPTATSLAAPQLHPEIEHEIAQQSEPPPTKPTLTEVTTTNTETTAALPACTQRTSAGPVATELATFPEPAATETTAIEPTAATHEPTAAANESNANESTSTADDPSANEVGAMVKAQASANLEAVETSSLDALGSDEDGVPADGEEPLPQLLTDVIHLLHEGVALLMGLASRGGKMGGVVFGYATHLALVGYSFAERLAQQLVSSGMVQWMWMAVLQALWDVLGAMWVLLVIVCS